MPISEESLATIRRLKEASEDPKRHLSLQDVVNQVLVEDAQVAVVTVNDSEWVVGFGVEQHPVGLCRHLSVSHSDRNSLLDMEVATLLLEAFGFEPTHKKHLSVSMYRIRGITAHFLQVLP